MVTNSNKMLSAISFVVIAICGGFALEATSREVKSSSDPKHTFQQFLINVIGGDQTQKPPPGFVWVQLPEALFTTPSPGIYQPTQGANPPKLQANESSTLSSSLATSTVAPDLNKKCLKPRGQFPGNSCNTYVNCWDGVAVEQSCPDGLLFNPKGFCDYPENVNCQGLPVLDTMTSSSSTVSSAPTSTVTLPTVPTPLPPATTDASSSDLKKFCLKPRGQFPSSACNKFVNCWDDVVVEQECPEGLLFNPKGFCDYPTNVICLDDGFPTKNMPTKEASKRCLADFGTFREQSNCANYYTCIGGQIVAEYTCPQGFNFNDNIGVCDYADRVDCSHEPLVFNPKANLMNILPKNFLNRMENCPTGSVIRLNQQCTVACLCRDGLSEIVQCPKGLAYDSKTDKCLLPHLAKC